MCDGKHGPADDFSVDCLPVVPSQIVIFGSCPVHKRRGAQDNRTRSEIGLHFTMVLLWKWIRREGFMPQLLDMLMNSGIPRLKRLHGKRHNVTDEDGSELKRHMNGNIHRNQRDQLRLNF